jgi:hypothetical protein
MCRFELAKAAPISQIEGTWNGLMNRGKLEKGQTGPTTEVIRTRVWG